MNLKTMIKRAVKKAATKKAAPARKRTNTPRLPDAKNTPHEANAYARHLDVTNSTDYYRQCLRFVRECYMGNDGRKYNTAQEAWNAPGPKHKWTGDEMDIPYGAAVFSRRPNAPKDDAGHVFLMGGYNRVRKVRIVRSTDIAVQGGISVTTIKDIEQKWGHEILGWRGNLNGYDLNLGKSPNERKR